MNEQFSGAGVFIFCRSTERVLMFARKHDENALGLPGGKPEADETPEETANREIFEEIAMRFDVSGLESIAIIPDDGDSEFIAFIHYIDAEFSVENLTSADGHAVWVTIPELMERTKFPKWFEVFFEQMGKTRPEFRLK